MRRAGVPDCRGARLTWAALSIGGGGWPVEGNSASFQLLREDGKGLSCVHPFPAREAKLSQFAQDILGFKTETPSSSEHCNPRQTGMAAHTTASRALNFYIWYLGRQAFCIIYSIKSHRCLLRCYLIKFGGCVWDSWLQSRDVCGILQEES